MRIEEKGLMCFHQQMKLDVKNQKNNNIFKKLDELGECLSDTSYTPSPSVDKFLIFTQKKIPKYLKQNMKKEKEKKYFVQLQQNVRIFEILKI